MNGVAHTKGPWLMAAKPSSVVGWPIVAPQALGRVICSLNYADPKAFGGKGPGDGKFNEESRANGLLIAAAPDLLLVLSKIMNRHASRVIFHDRALADEAYAAILKAQGGE